MKVVCKNKKKKTNCYEISHRDVSCFCWYDFICVISFPYTNRFFYWSSVQRQTKVFLETNKRTCVNEDFYDRKNFITSEKRNNMVFIRREQQIVFVQNEQNGFYTRGKTLFEK